MHNIAKEHKTVRELLGHDIFEFDQGYGLQILKDNISLLTPKLLDEIDQVVASAGHNLIGKTGQDFVLKGRCDSFVVEGDVHYPTKINLLLDAIGKIVFLVAGLCVELGLTEWLSKGKAGVPQELGLSGCVLEDQHGYILHHQAWNSKKMSMLPWRWLLRSGANLRHSRPAASTKVFTAPTTESSSEKSWLKWCCPKRGNYPKPTSRSNTPTETMIVLKHVISAPSVSNSALKRLAIGNTWGR